MIRNNQIISQWCVSRRQLLPCVAPFLALEAELFLCRPVSYYRQPISLWCIIEPACVLYAEMWVTYGLKWVWKRILISQMLLSALQGGVGCMCVCIDVHVSFHMLLHAAGRLVRTLCTGSWETNCAARPGVGGRPSSARSPTHNWIDPLCNSPLWWTSSSISPDHRHSFRGHCVWTYCKCRPQRPHQVTTSLEKCCIANVCVFHLNLVFRRRAESDGKCWTPPFTPRHLSRKSSLTHPVFSFPFSTLICVILSPFPPFFAFSFVFISQVIHQSQCHPHPQPSLSSTQKTHQLSRFPGVSLRQAVCRQNTYNALGNN